MTIDRTPRGVSLETVRLAQGGDALAFTELVAQCKRTVFATIAHLIARPEDVEDVAQEAFLRLYKSIPRLQSVEAFDIWMFRLTTNAVYDYLRSRSSRSEVRMADMFEGQEKAATNCASRKAVREEQGRRRTLECVDSLLSKLSPSDRILLLMREVEGLSVEEVAEVLGIGLSAAKLRLFRARNRVRKALEEESAQTDYRASKPAFADGRT